MLDIAVDHANAGRVERAIEYYQYALRAYTPGASAPQAAADALQKIAHTTAAHGDRANTLRALRRLRGGLLSIRWLLSPFGDRLNSVNIQLAQITAEEQLALGQSTIRGRDLAQLKADHLALLTLDPTPTPMWSLIVLLGFFGWISGGYLTIARGLDDQARPHWGRCLKWGGFTAACFAVWIVGLINA